MRKVLSVEGMSCGHCEKAVKEALSGLESVRKVEVDLKGKKVEVEGDNLVDDVLKETIEDIGYDVLDIN
ncbi:MAG TPA: heavy-metal-associated domain-containing protein [Tepidimicrobium sp.]|nr:heavy-metal-associated domain-containing protein [Tepidimicrobium sp.]